MPQGTWVRVAVPLTIIKSLLAVRGHLFVSRDTSLGDALCNSISCRCPWLRHNCKLSSVHVAFSSAKAKALSMSSPLQPESTVT